jgi:hypothetical protein
MTAMQIDCGVLIETSKPYEHADEPTAAGANLDDALRDSPRGPSRKLSSPRRVPVPASTNGFEGGCG